MKRLAAEFVQRVDGIAEARAAVEQTAIVEAYRLNTSNDPRPLLAWQVQLRCVTDISRARGDESGANLCNELAFHLNLVGAYEGARPYHERALAIREEVLGPEHPKMQIVRGNLEQARRRGDGEAEFPQMMRSLLKADR